MLIAFTKWCMNTTNCSTKKFENSDCRQSGDTLKMPLNTSTMYVCINQSSCVTKISIMISYFIWEYWFIYSTCDKADSSIFTNMLNCLKFPVLCVKSSTSETKQSEIINVTFQSNLTSTTQEQLNISMNVKNSLDNRVLVHQDSGQQ